MAKLEKPSAIQSLDEVRWVIRSDQGFVMSWRFRLLNFLMVLWLQEVI